MQVQILNSYLAKEPIVKEKPIVTDSIREKWKSLDLDNISSIFVVLLQGLGDNLLTLPVLRKLKQRYPKSKITVLCREHCKGIFDHFQQLGIVDKIISTKEYRFLWHKINPLPVNLSKLISSPMEEHDLLINMCPFDSSLDLLIAEAKARIKVGLKGDIRPAAKYDIIVEDHMKSRMLHYLGFIEILNIDISDPDYQLEKISTETSNENHNPKIGISLGSTSVRKCWDVRKYTQICRELIDKYDAEIFLLGKNIVYNEEKWAELIVSKINEKNNQNIINTVNKTSISDLMGMISDLDLLITNDNGIMHLAAALDKKTIALFGPTNPQIWGPNGSNNIVLNVIKEKCDKTEIDHCLRMDCGRCIDAIKPEHILEQVNKIL